MTFYPEVMSLSQQKMLRRLGAIAVDLGFYLAGGTALAIQLGHRRSVDFDWFSRSAIEYRYPDRRLNGRSTTSGWLDWKISRL